MVHPQVGRKQDSLISNLGTCVNCLQISHERIFFGCGDGSVRCFDLRLHSEIDRFELGDGGYISVLEVLGRLICIGTSLGLVRSFSLPDGLVEYSDDRHLSTVHHLVVGVRRSWSGAQTTCLFSSSADGTIRRHDFRGRNSSLVLHCFDEEATAFAFHGPGIIYVGLYSGAICEFNTEKSERIRMLQGHSDFLTVLKVAEGRLVSASSDGYVRCWDLKSGSCDVVVHADSPIYCMVVGPQRPCFQARSLPFEWLIVGLQSGALLKYDGHGAIVARFAHHTQAVFTLGTTNDGMLVSGSRDESVVRLRPNYPCEFCTCHCPPRLGAPCTCRCERCIFFRDLWDARAVHIQQFFRNRRKAGLRRQPSPVNQSPPRSPTPPPDLETSSPPIVPQEEEEKIEEVEEEPAEEPAAPSEEPTDLVVASVLPPLPRKRCGGGFSLVYPASNRKLAGSRSKSSGLGGRNIVSSAEKRHSFTNALDSAHGSSRTASTAVEASCCAPLSGRGTMGAYSSSAHKMKRASLKLSSAAKLSSSGKGSACTSCVQKTH